MQLNDEELKIVAFYRAAKENRTQKKTAMIFFVGLALVVLDIILVASRAFPGEWSFGFFIVIMLGMSFANYFIRKPEKPIADRILKEG